jgi:uncharacterized protein (TIGR01777 family)
MPVPESGALRVLVAGASGYVGTEFVRQLKADGHTVDALTRSETNRPGQHRWNPTRGELDPALIEAADAVVNFAGASIAKLPWSSSYQKEILASRIAATDTIVNAINAADSTPGVLLNASAVGFYGDRPGATLTEDSAKGIGFLADVVDEWEAAANKAATRVVTFRTGLVVGEGGAFGPLGLLTKFGLAARIGTGAQFWPWIALYDEAAAIRHLLTSDLTGPVNLEGPVPATSEHVTRQLAKAMKRWHPWVLPEFLISTTLGTAGKELLLPSQKAVPSKLLADGFEFRYRTVDEAIAAVWK